jgi:hypothetical protein
MTAASDGLLYDIGFNDIKTGIADAEVKPGVFVTKGTGERGVKLPAAVADVSNSKLVRGFVIRDLSKEADENGKIVYKAKDAVSVLRKGRIWAKCENAFTHTDSVYVRITASSPNLQLGQIRTDADTSNAVLLSGVKILNSGSAGQLALLEVDL